MHKLSKAFLEKKKEIQARANLGKIKLAQAVAWNLIMTTPVDTSKALSNWIVNLSSPKYKIRKAFFVGMDGSTHSQSSSMAYSMANAVIQRAKIGQIIYITNSLDYIELLNQGYSQQAPDKFIELAVENSVKQLKGMRL